jgi:hypothetical protein
MTADELLLALKDIQEPLQPGWWQIAPVWWALLLVLLGLGLFSLWLSKRRQTNHLVNLARRELEEIVELNKDKHLLATKLSVWLKQVALLAFPDRQLQSVTGPPWLDFLDQCIDDRRFSDGPGKIFGHAIYSQEVDLDSSQIEQLCEQWLTAITPQLQQRSRA